MKGWKSGFLSPERSCFTVIQHYLCTQHKELSKATLTPDLTPAEDNNFNFNPSGVL